MGVVNTVAVEDPDTLAAAMSLVEGVVMEIDATCSRFRPDSELCELNRCAGSGDVAMSPVMERALVAALQTADMTSGLVDPTIGRCLEEVGYTVTFGALAADGPAIAARVHGVSGWRSLTYDVNAHTLRIPAGTAIDFGASAKAWAADTAAAAVEENLGMGVLVECGGDVAVRGPVPAGGWPVRVAVEVGASGEDILVHEGGLATSGTTSRRWRRGGVELHDIIDPATGMPVITPWAMVTVAAATCLEANAAATAALIMGERALSWLDNLDLPARLVRAGGGIEHAGGWAA